MHRTKLEKAIKNRNEMKNNLFKKNVATIIIVVLLSLGSKGQTMLSGIISSNTTLTYANSPFLVTSNLIVNQFIVVTVEPGVVVNFASGVQLLVRGKLVANGTALDSIYFTSNNQSMGSWAGIKIDNYSGAKVECSYFRGRYADIFFEDIKSVDSDTVIKLSHCKFDYNNQVINSTSITSNNKKYYNACTFAHNSSVNQSAYNSTFKNSILYDGVTGIKNFEVFSLPTIIDSCIVHDFTNYATGGRCTITHSTIFNNFIGVGIWQNTTLHFNFIYQNTIGLNVNYTSINPTNQITQNQICNNATNVKMYYSSDFNALNNCWCLNNSAQIGATMHDFFAAAGLGIVNYTPFDTNCSLIISVHKIAESNANVLIYPNPYIDKLNVKINTNEPTEIILYDIQSGKILEQTFTNTTAINTEQLAKGIYLYTVRNKNGIIKNGKVIKE